jgi:hypothetical protein
MQPRLVGCRCSEAPSDANVPKALPMIFTGSERGFSTQTEDVPFSRVGRHF